LSSVLPPAPLSTLFPYTTLFRSHDLSGLGGEFREHVLLFGEPGPALGPCIEEIVRHEAAELGVIVYHRRLVEIILGPWASEEERSEEHTSELQSRFDLVCRLLLE